MMNTIGNEGINFEVNVPNQSEVVITAEMTVECVMIGMTEKLGVHAAEVEEIIEAQCVIVIVQVLKEIYPLQLRE